ncbi:MAG: sugar phosphate isomerase/epimerase family protein [Pirellulaceae bacterium]
MINRRQALQTTLGAGLAALTGSHLMAEETDQRSKLVTFTKPLQSLSYDDLADRIAECGFEGIEAPVRSGGHIVPEDVEEELPKMVEALKKRDLTIEILTSSINSVDSPNAERTLQVAKELGIKQYRMAYYRYDLKKPIPRQLREFGAKLKDLVAMNQEIGIQGSYQNHSGDRYVGAPLWDLYHIMREHPAEAIGSGFDIGHATIEGSKSWPIQWNLFQTHLASVYIKDFQWIEGQPRWVPLGEGQLSGKFFESLRQSTFRGPITLHIEYGDHAVQPMLANMKRDVATLKKLLGRA